MIRTWELVIAQVAYTEEDEVKASSYSLTSLLIHMLKDTSDVPGQCKPTITHVYLSPK